MFSLCTSPELASDHLSGHYSPCKPCKLKVIQTSKMKLQCEHKYNAMESSYQGASPITKGLHFGSRNFWSTLKVHPHHQKSSRHLKRRTFRLFLTFYTASLVSSSKVPISQSSQEILPAILSSIFPNINFWFCEVKNP